MPALCTDLRTLRIISMWIWVFTMVGVIFLDQFTKWLAVLFLQGQASAVIIPGALQLTYLENTGAAFGILKDHRWVFLVLSTLAIIGVMVYMWLCKPKSRLLCLALSMIVGGGVGNMIDRVILGYVVDFVDFCLIHFAIFNVADIFVCVGAGLLALYVILETVKEEKVRRAAAAAGGGKNADGTNADRSGTDEHV